MATRTVITPTPEMVSAHIARWGEPEDSTWECPLGHRHRTSNAALVHGGTVGHHTPSWLAHVTESWDYWHEEVAVTRA